MTSPIKSDKEKVGSSGEMKCPTCGYVRQGETPTGRFLCPNCQKMIVYDADRYESYLREKIKREEEPRDVWSGLTQAEKKSSPLSSVAIAISAVGIVLIGGVFLTVPGFIIAIVAWTQNEPKGKYAAAICGVILGVNLLIWLGLTALFSRVGY